MISKLSLISKPSLFRFGQCVLALTTLLGSSHWAVRAIASNPSPDTAPLTISQAAPVCIDPTWTEGNETIVTYTDIQGGHDRPARAVAFSPDGQYLVSAGADRTLNVWNIRNVQNEPDTVLLTRSFAVDSDDREIVSLAFSPDGELLASGSLNGTVRLWDWQTGELLQTLSGHLDAAASLAFTPDGQILASGSFDDTIRFWNVTTGMQEQVIEVGQDVTRIAFTPDGANLTVTGVRGDRALSIWDWQEAEEPVQTVRYARSVQTLALSPDGQFLALSPDSQSPGGPAPTEPQEVYNSIRLLGTEDLSEVGDPLLAHGDYITDLAFSPCGQLLTSVSLDSTIRIWDLEQQTLTRTIQNGNSAILTLAYRSDGRAIAVGRRDGSVSILVARD
ncbi:WD40 repeat domain-containing protein [Vacuolonema iberomarrocanum]|uniref:WD40 repeat domain-containing protein n=1 Tax=Vacuolonema iberomarrocanum TaxID=3454632 RepID=UPI0019E7ABFB|nr:WD40 repeat domain-containing protein [filamentous cyanobacterium LEGE 07170]